MNYIGSKFSLLPHIERILDAECVPPTGVALDLFAGTGVVAQFLKRRGHITYANDWQFYSYLTCMAYLQQNEPPEFALLQADTDWWPLICNNDLLPIFPVSYRGTGKPTMLDAPAARVLSFLSQLPGGPGPFSSSYCEGGESGRLYFSQDNGQRIVAIRDQIESWSTQQLITPVERGWLVASLLEGADRVANTASVYGAYLKRLKQSARNPLKMYFPVPVPSPHEAHLHRVFCEDSEHLAKELSDSRLTLVYIDPPYNSRQYNSNYHILETIARWDLEHIEPRGVTGLRNREENRSRYCLQTASAAFRSLLGSLNSRYILFSYSNEGLVSRSELEAMFADYCSYVRFDEIPYKRFRSDSDGENRVYSGDSSTEYLILGELKQPVSSEALTGPTDLKSSGSLINTKS